MKVRARGELVTLLAAVLLTAAGSPSASASAASRADTLSQHGVRVLGRLRWDEARYVVAGGETVQVSVSPAYASDPQAGQRWADFFASLPHNSELARLDAYVAPLDEVERICGGRVLGCYGSNHLVTMGESNDGVTAQSVAAHEYGHHIAQNRNNAPWLAIDWGTKRWASVVGVCARQLAGTAFPGAEDEHYFLNPGEAFAESYRVLAETDGSGAAFDWPIVDPSFLPDAAALAAVRADVVDPWNGPRVTTVHTRFKGSARRWTTRLETELDGDLTIRIDVPDDVSLVADDGRTVLARSTWTSGGHKEVHYRICGARRVQVRVSRSRPSARFTLRITEP